MVHILIYADRPVGEVTVQNYIQNTSRFLRRMEQVTAYTNREYYQYLARQYEQEGPLDQMV